MQGNKIFQVIDSLYDDYIKVWEDVCNIESPTENKAGVDAVGNYFADMALDRGWKVEFQKNELSGNVVCITLNPDVNEKPITLSGHMDTVHPIGSFGTPAVRIDEEKIYGPGVTDCKGGIVAGFCAMDALHKCGFRKRPVQLLLQCDEEVGSSLSGRTSINYICEKAKGSVAFLNLEGHTYGEACLIRKGIANFTFTVTGAEAHSSNCSKKGANAIAEAAYKILELEKLKDPEGVTCNCGVISGGTTPNTVPGSCVFTADIRFQNSEQFNRVCDHIQKTASISIIDGCSTKAELTRVRVAMERSERNEELLERMNEIFDDCGLPILSASKRAGGSDAADVTAFGIPCVDSLGVSGGMIHTRDEFSYLKSLNDAAKRLAAVIYNF